MWFNWNGKNSMAMGLWISKLPKIVVPSERVKTVTIPGRAGELNILEGEDVYDAYQKDISVTCINDVVTPDLLDWLHGSGELIIANESQFVYQARISGEVRFERVGNNLRQATIPFVVQPFKKSTDESQYRISVSATTNIVNPGNVVAKPKMTLTGTGALELTYGNRSMIFTHRPSTLFVDCDAEIMTTTAEAYNSSAYYYKGDFATWQGSQAYESGLYRFTKEGVGESTEWEYVSEIPDEPFEYLWFGNWSGEYLRIPVGTGQLSITGTATVTIDPQWRWK